MRIGEDKQRIQAVSMAAAQGQEMDTERGGKRRRRAAKNTRLGAAQAPPSLIRQKKERAARQARKMIADAFKADSKLSDSFQERRDKIGELKAESGEASMRLKAAREQQDMWKREYQVEDDSQEQKDLELLYKRQAAENRGMGVVLSPEERSRLAKIDQKGLTEYQKRCLEVNQDAEAAKGMIERNRLQIESLNSSIRMDKIDMLQYREMGKAQDAADGMMLAAVKEAVGGYYAEAKQHIEEKLEEAKEKAKEHREKEEAQEEKIENRREQRAEQEARIKLQSEQISEQEREAEIQREKAARQKRRYEGSFEQSGQFVEMSEKKNTLQEDVKKMLSSMGLLDEDVKGVSVDEML